MGLLHLHKRLKTQVPHDAKILFLMPYVAGKASHRKLSGSPLVTGRQGRFTTRRVERANAYRHPFPHHLQRVRLIL